MYPFKIPHNYDALDLEIIYRHKRKVAFQLIVKSSSSEVKWQTVNCKMRFLASSFTNNYHGSIFYVRYQKKKPFWFRQSFIHFIYQIISWNPKMDYVLLKVHWRNGPLKWVKVLTNGILNRSISCHENSPSKKIQYFLYCPDCLRVKSNDGYVNKGDLKRKTHTKARNLS